MKVKFKKNIDSYSGKDKEEGIVYSAHNNGTICIAKNYTKPKTTDEQVNFGNKMSVVRGLWVQVSDGYKADLKDYSHKYSMADQTKLGTACYSMFIKLMYAYEKHSGISLFDMNIESLRDSDIKTVKSALENGLLPDLEMKYSYKSVI